MRKRRDVFVRDTRLPPTLREQKNLYNRLCSKSESKLTKLEIELLDLVKKNLVKHGYLGPDAEPLTKPLFLSKKALTRRLNQIKQILVEPSNSLETEKLMEELSSLEGKLEGMRVKPLIKSSKPRKRTPTPKNYLRERSEKIDQAHKVSGYNKVRAQILQGGRTTGK